MAPVKITRKQNLLMHMLLARGGGMSSVGFQKLLFFLTRKELETRGVASYEFYPHIRGGYSFTVLQEKTALIDCGILENVKDGWQLRTDVALPQLAAADYMLLNSVMTEFAEYDDVALIRKMYREHPHLAVNSIIAKDTLHDDPEALRRIEASKPRWNADIPLYTIGYEGLSIEEFFSRLHVNGIHCLIDVRRVAFSHKRGFSRERLSDQAQAVKVTYRHYPELGIASSRRRELATQEDYDALFAEYEKYDLPGMEATLRKIAGVIEKGSRVALMCMEARPEQCHRTILARQLAEMIGCEYLHLTKTAYPIVCQKELNF